MKADTDRSIETGSCAQWAARLAGRLQAARGQAGPGAGDVLLRATLRLERIAPLDWLVHEGGRERFYGATRQRSAAIEIGGWGVADEAVWPEACGWREVMDVLRARLAAAAPGVRYYGGFRFAPSQPPDEDWAAFGAARFIVPRLELVATPEDSLLSLHARPAEIDDGTVDAVLERLAAMTFTAGGAPDGVPVPLARRDHPDRSGWNRNVEAVLSDCRQGRLSKVVLARKADFLFADPLDPVALLRRLKAATPDCFHFCYMPDADTAFVGASPERLYRREGTQLMTEAVAGTRMRGAGAEEDRRLGRALLESDKEQREHRLVRDGIREALQPLCAGLEIDPAPQLQQLARSQHLYSAFHGELRPGVDDADLLAALHPTAALGGSPTAAALARIAELEPFDRGWYAGPVGWVAPEAAEFAVAIRSGLVRPRKLSLFSGAGIVQGSTPDREWEEIELKICDFIKVLTAS